MADVTSHIRTKTLRARLTEERLASYDAVTGGHHTGTLTLYEWNTEASAALFASLQGFEVILRNALHRELTAWHTTQGLPGAWYDDPRGVFESHRQADIAEVRRRIQRLRRSITPGRMVSELSFGFWRYLLSARYEQSLWTPALRHAFPELRPQRRREIADRVARLHLLRNRLAHHEPIHRRDLTADYADLIFVASAICPHAAAWIERNSTVVAVLSRRPSPRPPAPRRPPAERLSTARRRSGGDTGL